VNTESESIRELFTEWIPLSMVRGRPSCIPHKTGLYVFRFTTGNFGRLAGESDIVYIGSSEDLNERIVTNYLKGQGGETTKRIHLHLIERGYIERIDVSFAVLPTAQEGRETEKELLKQYEADHHELPPWNRAE